MSYGIIYEILCTKTNLRYVGQTVQTLAARWRAHVKASQKGIDWELPRAIREHGIESFKKRIICKCESQNELNEAEKKWINELNVIWPNGYNMRNGSQYTHEMTRRLMSEAKKGKHLSEEAKQKLSDFWMGHPGHWLGKKQSEASNIKRSEKMRGRAKPPRSEEHRKNMSEAKTRQYDVKHAPIIEMIKSGATFEQVCEKFQLSHFRLQKIIDRALIRNTLKSVPDTLGKI